MPTPREQEVAALIADAMEEHLGDQVDTVCSLGCQGISIREAGFVLCLLTGEEFLVTVVQTRTGTQREEQG